MDWLVNLLESFPGLAFIVPITVAALAIFKWGISRHDVHFDRRKEFLLHWKNPNELDDLSLEVLIRQLTGAYLPAVVVRRVLRRKDQETARTLLRLADMWRLVCWDPARAEAVWKPGTAHPVARKLRGALAWVAFLASFVCGASILIYVAIEKPHGSIGVAAAGWGVAFVVAGIAALVQTDAWGVADRWGNALLEVANTCDLPAPSVDLAVAPTSSP